MNLLAFALLICIVIIVYLWVEKENYINLLEREMENFENVLMTLKRANQLAEDMIEKNKELKHEIDMLREGRKE